jgi:hypothetical protein
MSDATAFVTDALPVAIILVAAIKHSHILQQQYAPNMAYDSYFYLTRFND